MHIRLSRYITRLLFFRSTLSAGAGSSSLRRVHCPSTRSHTRAIRESLDERGVYDIFIGTSVVIHNAGYRLRYLRYRERSRVHASSFIINKVSVRANLVVYEIRNKSAHSHAFDTAHTRLRPFLLLHARSVRKIKEIRVRTIRTYISCAMCNCTTRRRECNPVKSETCRALFANTRSKIKSRQLKIGVATRCASINTFTFILDFICT